MFGVIVLILLFLTLIGGYLDWLRRQRFGKALLLLAMPDDVRRLHAGGLFTYPKLEARAGGIVFFISAMPGGGMPEAPRRSITYASSSNERYMPGRIVYTAKPLPKDHDPTRLSVVQFDDVFEVTGPDAQRPHVLGSKERQALLSLYRACGAVSLKLVNKTLTLSVPGVQSTGGILQKLSDVYGAVAPSFFSA